MASTLGNGTLTFGDGTVQSTKTPTVISAFTNDSAYLTNANVSSSYATITNTVYRFTSNGAGGSGSTTQSNSLSAAGGNGTGGYVIVEEFY
jgi:hypothetical protein